MTPVFFLANFPSPFFQTKTHTQKKNNNSFSSKKISFPSQQNKTNKTKSSHKLLMDFFPQNNGTTTGTFTEAGNMGSQWRWEGAWAALAKSSLVAFSSVTWRKTLGGLGRVCLNKQTKRCPCFFWGGMGGG